jgi:hypothetical protein
VASTLPVPQSVPSPDPPVADSPASQRSEDDAALPIATTPQPAKATYEERVVPADSVIGLRLDSTISSEQARMEERVEARVIRDVRVGGDVVIPAGSRAMGSVMVVERGGKFKERARLGIRFNTLLLTDGTRLPITTETIYRYGDSPLNSTTAKIGGGAVVGGILGGIMGGGKGAAVGASAGAGAGTAVVMAGDRNEAAFVAGSEVTARILSPVSVTTEK